LCFGLCCAASAWAVEVPVPRVAIYPGEIITEQALGMRDFRTALPRNQVVDTIDFAVGKVARRTLLPGQPIGMTAIKDPDVIVQGKAYSVIFQVGGLTITSLATPLQNGAVGDLVMLRNPDSGQIIKGIVLPNGTISVTQ
jgi:flagella basal body P-ring formation protein FlgA